MKRIFLSLVATLALVGCSKSDSGGPNIQLEEGTYPKTIETKNANGVLTSKEVNNIQGGKLLSSVSEQYNERGIVTSRLTITVSWEGDLPVREVYSGTNRGENRTIVYGYEGNKLVKKTMTSDGNNRSLVTSYFYSGDQLQKTVYEEPAGTRSVNGEIVQVTIFEETEYVYNGDLITANHVSYTLVGTGANATRENTSTSSSVYTLTNGNLMRIVQETTAGRYVYEYTYDDKNNYFDKGLVKLLDPSWFSSPSFSKNNILTQASDSGTNTPQIQKRNEYTYNDKGYPLTMKTYTVSHNNTNNSTTETLDLEQTYTY